MNAPAPKSSALMTVSIPSLAMSEAELIGVLKSSIYPGADDASVKLVIGYCRAAQLDPLQKPVHIVPMDVKVSKNPDKYEKRDVIMPGIGLYRVQAARTGEYAGMTEPVFGEMVDLEFEEEFWEGSGNNRQKKTRNGKIKYPNSCTVTVRRNVGGVIVDFTATEYWLENYATAGNWTAAPNKMWKKRPMGQLAKCAEAQALRKAFPEIGAAPTAEEMAGKTIDVAAAEAAATPRVQGPEAKTDAAATGGNVVDGTVTEKKTDTAVKSEPMRPSQATLIRKKLEAAGLTEVDLYAKFPNRCFEPTEGKTQFTVLEFNDVQAWITERANAK